MHTSKSPVSLTFDDGREEQYSKFYPILNEYNLNATFYIVTQRINWRGVMSWDELKIIHKDGNEIGSHTHTHPHLTTLSDSELDFELKKSKDLLRPFNCCTLAYPYGEYDGRVVGRARKYYTAARGYYNPNTRDKYSELNLDLNRERYRLAAFPVEHAIPSKTFVTLQNCSLFALPFCKFRETLKGILEYHRSRNAWVIFIIHGSYHWRNISWILKKPREISEHFVTQITKRFNATRFPRKKRVEKDKISKFRWMCEYFAQNDQIEVLPISQITRKYIAD